MRQKNLRTFSMGKQKAQTTMSQFRIGFANKESVGTNKQTNKQTNKESTSNLVIIILTYNTLSKKAI